MTDIDLTTVPLSALTQEVKRRMQEFETARKELGNFGVDNVRARVATPARKQRTSSNKGGRNSEETIVKLLKDQAAQGWTNAETAKHGGVSQPSISVWKKKYGAKAGLSKKK